MTASDKKRVVPKNALDFGNVFQYPDLEESLRQLMHKL